MDRTVKFETYSRIVPAIRYDGTFESIQAISAFAVAKVHLRYGSEPVFMSEFGLVKLEKGDWVVEIAEGRFVPMKEATRQAVFAPRFEQDIQEDAVDAFVYAVNADWTHTMAGREPLQAGQFVKANELGEVFAADGGQINPLPHDPVSETLLDRMVPRREPLTEREQIEAMLPPGQGVILIREDHPHHKLINSILSLTGISDTVSKLESTVSPFLAVDQPYEIALLAMKAGYRVARALWNGKAWLVMSEGRKLLPSGFWNKHTRAFAQARSDAARTSEQALTQVAPYINAVDVDRGTVHMGYNLDADDQFATDWCILEN